MLGRLFNLSFVIWGKTEQYQYTVSVLWSCRWTKRVKNLAHNKYYEILYYDFTRGTLQDFMWRKVSLLKKRGKNKQAKPQTLTTFTQEIHKITARILPPRVGFLAPPPILPKCGAELAFGSARELDQPAHTQRSHSGC